MDDSYQSWIWYTSMQGGNSPVMFLDLYTPIYNYRYITNNNHSEIGVKVIRTNLDNHAAPPYGNIPWFFQIRYPPPRFILRCLPGLHTLKPSSEPCRTTYRPRQLVSSGSMRSERRHQACPTWRMVDMVNQCSSVFLICGWDPLVISDN